MPISLIPRPYFASGRAYYFVSDYDRAIADFTKSIELGGREFAAAGYQDRSNAWRDKGDLQRSMADINLAIQFAPRSAVLYSNRAMDFMLMNDDENALADLNRSLQIDPRFIPAINRRVILLVKRRQFEAAKRDSDELVRLAPQDSAPLHCERTIGGTQGDLIQALNNVNSAVQIGGELLSLAYYERAEIHRYMGQVDSAISDFNQSLRLAPKYPPAFVGRGLAFEKQGDRVKAKADFQTAIQMQDLRHGKEFGF